MQRVKVLVCGIADLTKKIAETFNITVVPYYITIGGETFVEDFDFDKKFYYTRIADLDELPKTSHPNTHDLRELFSKISEKCRKAIYLTAPKKLTKTYDLACRVAEEFSDLDIRIVDTGSAVGKLGLIAVEAAGAAMDGLDIDMVEKRALETARRTNFYMVLETLKNLLKGGRIGRVRALLGQVLSIKPIVTLKDGVATPAGKALTARQALEYILRKIAEDINRLKGNRIRVIVEHANHPEWAAYVKDKLSRSFEIDEIFETTMTAVVGTHAGPGAWGVAYHVI